MPPVNTMASTLPSTRDIRADIFFDPVAEHLNRQFCTIISLLGLIDNFPHVVQTADPLETALRIERFFKLIYRHARLSHHEEVERRIDVSRPGAHNQAFQWGQAHGSVYAQAPLDGCCTRAIAQMERDEILVLSGDLPRYLAASFET